MSVFIICLFSRFLFCDYFVVNSHSIGRWTCNIANTNESRRFFSFQVVVSKIHPEIQRSKERTKAQKKIILLLSFIELSHHCIVRPTDKVRILHTPFEMERKKKKFKSIVKGDLIMLPEIMSLTVAGTMKTTIFLRFCSVLRYSLLNFVSLSSVVLCLFAVGCQLVPKWCRFKSFSNKKKRNKKKKWNPETCSWIITTILVLLQFHLTGRHLYDVYQVLATRWIFYFNLNLSMRIRDNPEKYSPFRNKSVCLLIQNHVSCYLYTAFFICFFYESTKPNIELWALMLIAPMLRCIEYPTPNWSLQINISMQYVIKRLLYAPEWIFEIQLQKTSYSYIFHLTMHICNRARTFVCNAMISL